MNQHARFLALAAVAALTWHATPLGAQAAGQPDARAAAPALTVTGVAATAIIDSITAVATTPVQPAATTTAAVSTRGPSVASARVGSHTIRSSTRGAPPVLQNRSSNRNAVALMIVGGAALVVGAVIGDDAGTLVMLGGAGIGLYGLYLFLT
jgi:hypothetical protein